MSTTSPVHGFSLAEGNDTFDNDKYIKANFQKIDDTILPKDKTIAADGQNIEIVELSFVSSGTVNILQSSGTFAKTYVNPPTVMVGNISQSVTYSDTMDYPWINPTTNTTFSVTLKTSDRTTNFGAGTLKVRFVVIGS